MANLAKVGREMVATTEDGILKQENKANCVNKYCFFDYSYDQWCKATPFGRLQLWFWMPQLLEVSGFGCPNFWAAPVLDALTFGRLRLWLWMH